MPLKSPGRFLSVFLLTGLYFILWVPAGILTCLFADWLHRRAPARSNWWARDSRINDPAHLKEPF